MNIHHTKHHNAYVTNVNAALDKFPELKGLGLVDLNRAVGTDAVPAEVATAVGCARPAAAAAVALLGRTAP
jgi:Fe-Mn family superoxide dismutase